MWVESFTNKDGIEQFRFIEKYKDPLTNKWRRTSVVMNKNNRQSEKEAMKRLDEKIAKKLRQDDSVTKTLKELTFYELSHEYYKHYEFSSGTKKSTLRNLKSMIKTINKLIRNDILANKINVKVLQTFVNQLQEQSYNTKVIGMYLRTVKNILSYGVEYYSMDDISYIDRVVIPKKASTREEIQAKRENYLELSQVNSIVAKLRKESKKTNYGQQRHNYNMIAHIVELQALNGMRIGELLAIQESDIDFKNMTLEISGTISWHSVGEEHGFKDTTKTDSSYRTISLTNRSIDILRKVILEKKKLIQWEERYMNRGFLFVNRNGNPMPLATINRIIQETAHSVGIDKHITTHTLRHSHISLLSQLGVSLKAIMERVGHTDHKTTLQIYSHVTEQMDKDMMNKLEAVTR